MSDKAKTKVVETEATAVTPKDSKLACGIVMPISAQPGCSAEHWAEVRSIIEESISTIDSPHFDARLVSDADDVGVIQKRIVQNIYSSEIIVCDVSCKNSNVMFELGMRLAFDKPTVIIKDDQTDYSFDTGIIEHITYPRDLRFSKIVLFKKALAEKVRATYLASLDSKNSTFLKNFGTFHVASLSQADASPDQMALELLSEIQGQVSMLRNEMRNPSIRSVYPRISREERSDVSSRLRSIIGDYAKNNALKTVSHLKDDQRFVDLIESILPAGEYFPSRSSFLKALHESLEMYDLI